MKNPASRRSGWAARLKRLSCLLGSAGDLNGARLFEFGCGTGRNLARSQSAGAAPVAGCDVSEGMPTIARRRCPGADLYRHDRTKPLPFAVAGLVDLALFSFTLEHVDDPIGPLSEARRILRPGGRIAIFEIHPFLSLSGVVAHFEDACLLVQMPTVAHQFASDLEAFARLNLRVPRCREWRPCDIGAPATLKALKRGPDFPLPVEFLLEPGPAA